MFRIYFRSRALQVLEKSDREIQIKINVALDDLKIGNFKNHNIKKIQGVSFGYRLRIGRWRILFAMFVKQRKIEVVDIFIKKGKEDYFKRRKLFG